MSIFGKKKKNAKQQTPANDLKTADVGAEQKPIAYQGPNVLGVLAGSTAFIYGQPIHIKVNSGDPKVVQAGMFIKDSDALAKLPNVPSSILASVTEQGLPVRLTINTANSETAQALVNQLSAMPDLMMATVGTVTTRTNRQGIRQIELLIPFGAFIMISTNNVGEPTVTTTNITVSDNTSTSAEPRRSYHPTEPESDRQQAPSFNTKPEPSVSEPSQPSFNDTNSKPADDSAFDLDDSDDKDDFQRQLDDL